MLTIFSIPKPFVGHIKVIQTNAIRSWVLLRPKCEVILLGDEGGTAEVASDLGICHVTDVERNDYGTPLVSSMFRIAQDVASHKLMCYVNADIILMSDFLAAIRQIKWQSFLLIGQRWDIDLKESIDFSNENWEEQLRAYLAREGKLHTQSALDYFVFPGGVYRDIPPFAVGRPAWDNWVVYQARSQKIPVIDATRVITVVHQNHDYSHHPMDKVGIYKGPEAERNRKLLGGNERAFGTNHATHILTLQGTKRALSIEHLYYRITAIPALVPYMHSLNLPISLLMKVLIISKNLVKSIFHR